MRSVSLALLALTAVAALPAHLFAADDATPASTDAPAGGDAPAATDAAVTPADRSTADAQSKEGVKALRDSDGDPHRAVDAALDFTHALKIYEALGDTDEVNEMQADIYWCKKKMNLDNLDDYLRQKNASADDAQAMKDVLNKEVAVTEAQAYFDRAQKYVDANPNRHFQNAIRFSEVVERFPDTDPAKKAEPLMAKEQDAFLAEVKRQADADHAAMTQAIDSARESRFTKPPVVDPGSTEVPDQAARDKALTTLKELYKADYSKRKDNQKRAFSHKLFTEAESSKDDAAVYYEMLSESVRLAAEGEDYAQLLDAEDRMGGTFAGFDENADKKKTLKYFRSKPTAAAILTLMDTPKDKAANSVAGRFFCLSMSRWDLGLPMLALGGDKDLHDVAELELADPHETAELLRTGDAWYDLGKHNGGSSADKIAMWTRAEYWFQQVMPNLTGVSKDRIAKEVDEIDKVIPQVITDWDHLTPGQWDRIKAPEMVIPAKFGRNDSGVDISADKHVRIVPQPNDKWDCEVWGDSFTCNYKGVSPNDMRFIGLNGGAGGGGRLPPGSMVYQIGTGEIRPVGVVTGGTGPLYIMALSNNACQGTEGQIRIKIVPVSGDD